MDATSRVPGRPLNWLPPGLTAFMLSLEKTDSLSVQLKAFSVTQAVKALLSSKSQKDLWGVPTSSSEFNRSASLDALRELAKPLGGAIAVAGLYGGVSMHLAGFHTASISCQCESEEFCECNHSYGLCVCGDPDCLVCERCASEEDFEPRECEENYGPELQHHWGFPFTGSVLLNSPNARSPKYSSDAYFQGRRDTRSQRFANMNRPNVQNFGWANPLERRAAFGGKDSAQGTSGSSWGAVQESMTEDDGQDLKGVSEKLPSTWAINVVRKRKGAQNDLVGSNTEHREKEEDRQSSENAEASLRRVDQGSEETETAAELQERRSTPSSVSEAVAAVKPSQNKVTALKSPKWWPFGLQSAASAVDNEPAQTEASSTVVNLETTKWNFRMGQNAGAGALAGGVVSLCLHPIDTVKTIIQAQTGSNRNLLPILSSVISTRGLKGLYRGLGSNLASSAPISAIYTLTYEAVKAGLLRHIPEDMSALAHCAAGGCASVATSIVYTPSECVKQQMQVNGLYRNSWQAFTSILKQGGLPLLYKGWGAVLFRNVPQSVIKFYTYEGLKHWVQGGPRRDTPLTTLQALAIGGAAGSTAAFFTTPFDVVKTRLQTQIPGSVQQYSGVVHAFQCIATTEGIAGLYRGLVPRLVIYVTQGALFFASYEFIKHILTLEAPKLRMKSRQIGGYERQAASTPAEFT